MTNLSTFEQDTIQITKEQLKSVDDAVMAFNETMLLANNPVRLEFDDVHNTKEFFIYTDKITTEPSIINDDGYRIFNGDICRAYASGVGGLSLDYDENHDVELIKGIDVEADKQPIHIFVDEKGITHAEMDAYAGTTGDEPDDGPAWEGKHEFEPEQITLIESK